MALQELSGPSFAENVAEMDIDEENDAISSFSAAYAAFDVVIGCIEHIVIDEEFHQLQQSFLEEHYLEFDDSEENKLSYTPIFNKYVELLESHLERLLKERIPDFNMTSFTELLMQHKEEVPNDIFFMLQSFTDFMSFKEMFLEYRAVKEGRSVDPSQELTVRSVQTHQLH